MLCSILMTASSGVGHAGPKGPFYLPIVILPSVLTQITHRNTHSVLYTFTVFIHPIYSRYILILSNSLILYFILNCCLSPYLTSTWLRDTLKYLNGKLSSIFNTYQFNISTPYYFGCMIRGLAQSCIVSNSSHDLSLTLVCSVCSQTLPRCKCNNEHWIAAMAHRGAGRQ